MTLQKRIYAGVIILLCSLGIGFAIFRSTRKSKTELRKAAESLYEISKPGAYPYLENVEDSHAALGKCLDLGWPNTKVVWSQFNVPDEGFGNWLKWQPDVCQAVFSSIRDYKSGADLLRARAAISVQSVQPVLSYAETSGKIMPELTQVLRRCVSLGWPDTKVAESQLDDLIDWNISTYRQVPDVCKEVFTGIRDAMHGSDAAASQGDEPTPSELDCVCRDMRRSGMRCDSPQDAYDFAKHAKHAARMSGLPLCSE